MTPTRIAILAPGLIGGSVALAATRAFPKAKIAIWTRRADSISSIQSALPKAEISTDLSSLRLRSHSSGRPPPPSPPSFNPLSLILPLPLSSPMSPASKSQ